MPISFVRGFKGGDMVVRTATVPKDYDQGYFYDFEEGATLKEAAISKADPWLAISDEELWSMVPGQDLPRCIDVTFDRLTSGPKSLGCLQCGG